MTDTKKLKLKFIGCEIIYREACYLAATSPHHVDVEFLRKGLHDLETADMNTRVQAAIDAVDAAAAYDAIILGYARCNDGLVGIQARNVPLVIPRAHDCITFFFGSRQAYREYFDCHPGTYYMTTGWSERNAFGDGQYSTAAYGKQGVMAKLGLADSYDQMVAKYGKENADFIMESMGDWTRNYRKMLYLKMFAPVVFDEAHYVEQARLDASQKNWEFELREGKWDLLQKLFYGQWDSDFVFVQPGMKLAARNDERVLEAEPSALPTAT